MWASRTVARASAIAGALTANIGSYRPQLLLPSARVLAVGTATTGPSAFRMAIKETIVSGRTYRFAPAECFGPRIATLHNVVGCSLTCAADAVAHRNRGGRRTEESSLSHALEACHRREGRGRSATYVFDTSQTNAGWSVGGRQLNQCSI